MMASNSSGRVKRPGVSSGAWISMPSASGSAPMAPPAAWLFCSCTARSTSLGASEKFSSRPGSSQMRMA